MTNEPDLRQVREKRPWKWVAIIATIVIVVGLLGTCVQGFGRMFRDMQAMQARSDDLVASAFQNGLPLFGETLYSEHLAASDEDLDFVNGLMEALGPPMSSQEPTCSAKTLASTSELSGRFVSCEKAMQFEDTPGTISIGWRFENEDWALLSFNVRIEDAAVYRGILADMELERRGVDLDRSPPAPNAHAEGEPEN